MLKKHGAEIRKHFQIVEKHRRAVDELATEIRRDVDMVVGIHMRQGDYEFWRGGNYFYTIRQYATLMHNLSEQLSTKKIAFLLCTNGKFAQTDFKDLRVTLGSGHLVEDMYAFAETDMIIGPPSTYTEWASFYGQNFLSVMHTAEMRIDLSALTAMHRA